MTFEALGLLLQVKFDWTISLGNIVTGGSFLALCVVAWRDLVWRIKNLEQWRKEHMVDADARDRLLLNLELISARLEILVNHLKVKQDE